jgi:ATP-binding cassette subfamily F protein uup
MNLISVFEASKEIAGKVLYKDITFGIEDSDKIAIIGVNGSGKSTLLKILASFNQGDDYFDKGTFTSNKLLRCGYLAQQMQFNPESTIQEFIFSSDNERMKTLRDHLSLQKKIHEGSHENLTSEIERVEEKMNDLGVWKLEGEAKEILSELGIDDVNLKMKDLSGGMARKADLARLLIEDNNLLLMDEPTNHLDIESISWLENWLVKTRKAIVMITHDRYFLDNVVNHILEIDNFCINKFQGHYSDYLEKKTELAAIEKRTLAKAQNILTQELKWLNRMPKARGTKQKAKIQTIEARHTFVHGQKKKEEMGGFYSNDSRLGKKIMEAINISKSFDYRQIFPSFNYEFSKKDRIAVIGPNGAGKTTFLKILMKEIEPDTGSVVHGVNTRIGFLSQHSEKVDTGLTVIAAVKEIANYIELEDGKKITAGQLLERFLFTDSKQYQKVNQLSGGERRRLDIIRLLMTNPNFLVLDEPTNDLDLQTLSIFEDYLMDFPGCLLIVSHDRYFLDKLATSILIFSLGEPVQSANGSSSDFVETIKRSRKKTESIIPAIAVTRENSADKSSRKPSKLSYKYELRKKEIEAQIPELEDSIKDLEEKLSSGETSPEKLSTWGKSHIENEKKLYEILAELEKIEAMV